MNQKVEEKQFEFEERWYIEKCVDALSKDIISSSKTQQNIHPLAVMPTGSGKSVVIVKLIDKFLSIFPEKNVLIISHVEDILQQNYDSLINYYSDTFIGLYSAGLGQKEIKKVTVAGIQSIYKKYNDFENVGLVIIDEAHAINNKDKGTYRFFLKELKNCVYCGLTATPYRTGQGYIYKTYPGMENTLFNKLSYDLSKYEQYNKLVDEGYLCPLIPAPTNYKMNTSGIAIKNGDFDEKDLSIRFNREEITNKIIDNIIKYGNKKYKKWLLFAIDIDHATNIAKELNARGIATEEVHSKLKKQKQISIHNFKTGKTRCLVNVGMLITGINIPEIDLIAILRPSLSPVFHVQSGGRGGRPCKEINKTHCLYLDFTNNTNTHGPLNDVYIKEGFGKNKKVGGDFVKMVKDCDNCGTANSLRAKKCIACDEEFKINHKLNQDSSGSPMKSSKKNLVWVDVCLIKYSIHVKNGSPNSLRVDYYSKLGQGFKQFVAIDHPSHYAKNLARIWIKNRLDDNKIISSLTELIDVLDVLKTPSRIKIDFDHKYKEVLDFQFSDKNPRVINTIIKNKVKNENKVKSDLISFNSDNNDLLHFDDDIPF